MVSNTTNYGVGDWIFFKELTNPDALEGDTYHKPGQISKITGLVPDNSITIKDEASKQYKTSYDLTLYKINPIENVGIENLSIERLPDGNNEGNGSTIFFEYAANCWVRGVETKDAFGRHITILSSSHIEISGCYIHEAYSYCSGDQCGGKDGRGYGIVVAKASTNCLIENNILRKTRHALLINNGANCNVFTYNYARENNEEWRSPVGCTTVGADKWDLVLHGKYSYANLFEQNWVTSIVADDEHANNGPYNAFIRNMLQDENGIMHKMILINAPNTSVLGCELRLDETYTPIVTAGNTSLSIDLYGILIYNDPPYNTYETGIMISHSDLAQGWYYDKDDMHLHDFSYFYSQRPPFVNTNYTFPSIGPEFTSQNIPAKDRYSNGEFTYNSSPTKKIYTITFENNFIGLNNSGVMKINSVQYTLPTNSFSVIEGDPITAEAINSQTFNSIIYRFDHWNDGTTTRVYTFSPYGDDFDLTYTAHFTGKPVQVQGLHDVGGIGQPIHLVWDVHPNSNCTYKIWRKTRNNSPVLIATLPHTSTSYIDTDYSKTGGYTHDLLSYDVRAYYTVEGTSADPWWWSVYGRILFKSDSTGYDSLSTGNFPKDFTVTNYPNPFNLSTTIRYYLPEAGAVRIVIYDIQGRAVRTFDERFQGNGWHFTRWDGLSENGNAVSSGAYWMRIEAGKHKAIRKLLLLK